MRDYCSGCGETYLDEHIDCCECGRYLCPFCLMEHRQKTGHLTREDRREIGHDFADLNTVISKEQSLAFSRQLETHREIYFATSMVIKTAYFSTNAFVSNPISVEHRLVIRINSSDFMQRLDKAGSIDAVFKIHEQEILEAAKAHIKQHNLPLCEQREFVDWSKREKLE